MSLKDQNIDHERGAENNDDQGGDLDLVRITPPARRAAIYVRVAATSDADESASRQELACRNYASEIGAKVIGPAYADLGASGTTLRRPRLEALFTACKRGEIDIVIVKDLDRVSRSLAGLVHVFEMLDGLSIELHEAPSGKVDLVACALKALLGQELRRTLTERLRIGQTAAVKAGKACSRAPFGFVTDRSTSSKGHRRIHDERASVVRKIYDDFDAGRPVRDIVGDLSGRVPTPGDCGKADRGVVVPKPSPWSADMIRRIILNPAYAGWLVYGRTCRVHEPETGNVHRIVPTTLAQQQVVEVPEWRIVEPELWAHCQERLSKLPPRGHAHASGNSDL